MQWFVSSGNSSYEGKKNQIQTVSSLFLNIGFRKIKLVQEALIHAPAGAHGSLLQFALSILRREQYSL